MRVNTTTIARIACGLTAAACALLVAACGRTGPLAAPVPARDAALARYSIVPWPASLRARNGAFRIGAETRVTLSDPANAELRSVASFLTEYIRSTGGTTVPISEAAASTAARGTIALVLTKAGPAEGYHLSVTPSSVTVSASTAGGLFHGVQTVRQLLRSGSVAAVEIEDAPRFQYRGMHLDVARHFFPATFVKKYIDLLALYKFNTLHWHLTEDQGWRVEIKRYPRLMEVGSCRRETRVGAASSRPIVFDGTPHCGFYTQDEIRDVVAYAKARHVNIIPEIELPGHSRAALAAYPELACGPGPFEVATTWGIFEEIYCPKEETFTFLEGVLTEVMQLFPSAYIHIGGDEAPKKTWQESPIARAVMQRENLKNEQELQSWFTRRIERFLNANGRKLIGWDEIVEGGLSPTATVMYWRDRRDAGLGHALDDDPARLAARSGNDVIMTPNTTFYLDHYQAFPPGEPLAIGGYSPLEEVYSYEPVPPDFTPAMAQHVLGAQANVWTEYMSTSDHVEYMVLPRLLAVAEVVWSPKQSKDFAWFTQRLPAQLRLLSAVGAKYRAPRPGEPGGATPSDVALAPPRVIGYLGSWGVRTKGLRIRQISGNRLTHIMYAFGRVGADGRAALGDPCVDTGECGAAGRPAEIAEGGNFAQLQALKRSNPHLRVSISLGGWTGSRYFSDAAASAAARRRLVQSTLDVFLRPYPGVFDGVDIDWEFPVAGGMPENTTRPEDKRNLTLLLEEYRKQLDALGRERKRHYELSIAASARPHEIANLELNRLGSLLDFIMVMTYDYHSVDTIAHFNAPLRAVRGDPTPAMNVDASMRVFTDAGVPRYKLIVGAPFYGRGYGDVGADASGLLQRGNARGATEWGSGGIDYRSLVQKEPERNGFTRYWHPEAQVPWLYNAQTRTWISYDDPESIAAKAAYVREQRFGGIMFWELGGDNGTLLRAIHQGLGLRVE
jgi:hexosaminidase